MTPWDYAADISAAVGGVASLVAVIVGTRALKDAHGARLDSARDRDRQRLERVADQIEQINRLAWNDQNLGSTTQTWRGGIGLLIQYLASTNVPLPRTRELTEQTSAEAATLLVVAARQEVVAQLIVLTALDAVAATPEPTLWQRIIKGTPAY
jgi:hypothetical protein